VDRATEDPIGGLRLLQVCRVVVKAPLLVLPVAVAFQAGTRAFLVLACSVAIVGVVGRRVMVAPIALTLSIAVHVLTMNFLAVFNADYSLDGRWVLSSVVLVTVVIAVAFRSLTVIEDPGIPVFFGFATILGALLWPARSMGDSQILSFVTGYERLAEDNAAWLVALSTIADGSDSELSAEAGFGGGNTTALTLALARESARVFGFTFDSASVENVRILVVASSLAVVGGALFSLLVVAGFTRRGGDKGSSMSWVTLPVYVSFAAGMSIIGHYSALVDSVFLLSAMVISSEKLPDEGIYRWLYHLAVAALLLAAGQAWLPMVPVVVLYAVWALCEWVVTNRLDSYRSVLSRAVLAATVIVVLAIWVFPGYRSNFTDWDYLRFNLKMTGGFPEVRLDLLVAIVAVSVYAVLADALSTENLLQRMVLLLTGTWILLVTMSYLVAPYQIQYGVLKYSYVVAGALAPVAIGGLVKWSGSRGGNAGAIACVFLVTVSLTLLAPPGAKWNWMHSAVVDKNQWAGAVVKAITASPSRPVGCVTVDPTGVPLADNQSYVCSRLAFAMGGHDEYVHRTWTAANICQIPPEQADAAFDRKFLTGLTVVVTVLQSGSPCAVTPTHLKGWLTSVDWNQMTAVGLDGEPLVVGK